MSTHPTGNGSETDPAEAEVRFTDRRRVDPRTGEVRDTAAEQVDVPVVEDATTGDGATGALQAQLEDAVTQLDQARTQIASLTDQVQRVQADFVNFRRRVERDQHVASELTVVAIIEALIPLLDDIDSARSHEEITGPFAAIVEKLEASLSRFGWQRYGGSGEVFDPNVHEALTHQHSDDVPEPTVSQVYQAGHRIGERIVRAARVGVIDPDA